MGLFGRNPKKRIKEHWSFVAGSSIWRIVLSDNGFFVCEDRDKEGKTVSFFCLEQSSGRLMWKDLQFEEKWWIGIESAYANYVFFHEYATPDMPDHKRIHAVDLLTGKHFWHNPEERFLFAAGDAVYTSKDLFERRVFHELDITTGIMRKEVDFEHINSVMKTVPDSGMAANFPAITHPLNAGDEKVKKALEKSIAMARQVALIEFLYHNGLYVIGYYDNLSDNPDKPRLSQYLVVIDSESGAVIYRDRVNDDVNAPLPDTFFSSGSNIFLVKGKKTLMALEIAS